MIKHPPIFAGQANIANGPQQVINGGTPPIATRAGTLGSVPNELMEAHGQRMDTGAEEAAGRGDHVLAPVGASHRPPKCRR